MNFDGAPAIVLRRLNQTDIGQMIETDAAQSGVLFSPDFQHVDIQSNKAVGPKFDYFTTDADTATIVEGPLGIYSEDIQRIADLSVYGHRGIELHDDIIMYEKLIRGEFNWVGSWHLGTLQLVNGRDRTGKLIRPC